MVCFMSDTRESITLTIPQSVAAELSKRAAGWNDRMHELLERNTDGALNAPEHRELEALVLLDQFAQILAMANTLAREP